MLQRQLFWRLILVNWLHLFQTRGSAIRDCQYGLYFPLLPQTFANSCTPTLAPQQFRFSSNLRSSLSGGKNLVILVGRVGTSKSMPQLRNHTFGANPVRNGVSFRCLMGRSEIERYNISRSRMSEDWLLSVCRLDTSAGGLKSPLLRTTGIAYLVTNMSSDWDSLWRAGRSFDLSDWMLTERNEWINLQGSGSNATLSFTLCYSWCRYSCIWAHHSYRA